MCCRQAAAAAAPDGVQIRMASRALAGLLSGRLLQIQGGWETIPLHIFRGRTAMNYTYILRCSDGTLYTGWTNHLEERVRAHNEGRGAKYTRPRLPVELIYFEEFGTKQEAMRREAAIKRMTHAQKLELQSGHAEL